MHPEHKSTVVTSQPTHVALPSDPFEGHFDFDGEDELQRIHQRQVLAKAHPKHPIPAFGKRTGPPRQKWFRPGAKRVREDAESLETLKGAEWVATRRGRPWTCNDGDATDALKARCFDYNYIEGRKIETRPTWLETLCRDQWESKDGPGFPVKAGFMRFVTDLLHARRAGAIGAILSQADAGTVYDVNPRHWRRWIAHAEATGLVRVLQLWQKDPTLRRHRGHWKLCYMLGHAAIERAGVALYEGLDRAFADGRPMKHAASAAAKRLRAKRRDASRARHNDLWHGSCAWAVRKRRIGASSLSPDMKSGPTLQSRVTGEPVPLVSPEGEISIARAVPAIEKPSPQFQGGGRDCPTGTASFASLARSNSQPTSGASTSGHSSVRGAKMICSADDASSGKTAPKGSVNAMLADLLRKLEQPIRVFLFFFVSTLLGCRETSDEYVGPSSKHTENPSSTSNPAATESGGTATGLGTAATGSGTGSGTAEDTQDVGSGDTNSTSGDESSWTEDDPWATSSWTESTPDTPWEDHLLSYPCVYECAVEANVELGEFCRAQSWKHGDDLVICLELVRDASLMRCAQDCECAVDCE